MDFTLKVMFKGERLLHIYKAMCGSRVSQAKSDHVPHMMSIEATSIEAIGVKLE